MKIGIGFGNRFRMTIVIGIRTINFVLVATLIMPDGSMLVSDDYAGVIYRIYYS